MVGLTADAGDNLKKQASIPLAPCMYINSLITIIREDNWFFIDLILRPQQQDLKVMHNLGYARSHSRFLNRLAFAYEYQEKKLTFVQFCFYQTSVNCGDSYIQIFIISSLLTKHTLP
jgi:hypothetical protein